MKKKGCPFTAKAFTFEAKFADMDDPKILLVDNYDSFTFNLVNVLRKVTKQFEVRKNDEIELDEVGQFDKILFSPGPDIPHKNDLMWQILDRYKTSKSILGVCLGFQGIGLYFGAKLFNLETVYHGQTRSINILDKQDYLFNNIKTPFIGGLYHSWGLPEESFPEELIITAKSNENRIMALRHKTLDIRGVQFHPESIMTPDGEQMIRNWVRKL